ncbi:MAG TPA: hypothetical protein VOA78_15365 [Candidatus Dormibacteraeota bacterium]|nr:hypothetical protein [Candidatus Dormibacteraeota bacterium]
MLDPERLAELTPESLAGLAPADKRRVMEILKDLELTAYQRFMGDLRKRLEAANRDCDARGVNFWEERQAKGLPGLAEVLEKVRKDVRENPNRQHSLGWQLYHAADHQAFLAKQDAEQAERIRQLAVGFQESQQRYLDREAAIPGTAMSIAPDLEPATVAKVESLEPRSAVRKREIWSEPTRPWWSN